MSLALVNQLFDVGLKPVAPFSWLALPVSAIDILGAIRLAVVLRQIREAQFRENEAKRHTFEEPSFTRDVWTIVTIVFGGEAIAAAFLGFTPSFLLSPTYLLLFLGAHALVHFLPSVPPMSLENEFPIAFLDATTRVLLLTALIPAIVLGHSSVQVSTSPYTLLMTSFITANGGFFLVNVFNMLSPHGWSVSTPAELKSMGWTTLDLWMAPFITALYALLTHLQPGWDVAHSFLLHPGSVHIDQHGAVASSAEPVKPLDAENARAVCTLVLMVAFAARALWNFGSPEMWKRPLRPFIRPERKQAMRSNGRRWTPGKVKTQ